MERNFSADKREPYKVLIIIVSIVVPMAVAALFSVRIEGYDFSFLPPIYATINGLTAVFLVWAVVSIKRGNRALHERLVKICILLSAMFLVMYILYHITSDPTPYRGEGPLRMVYFVILVSHIALSVVIIPLVLFTFMRAWRGDYERHRSLAKFAFPAWLYVAVTGVIVYLMISPYYQ